MNSLQFDAVVFPGQGAQKLGMAKDFVEAYPQSAKVFELADSVLPFDIYQLCFEDKEQLNLTEYTQPCIVTAEIAMYEALSKQHGLNPSYFAGHSLGEYAALVAAGVIPLATALKLVHRRGQLMQNAAANGGMTAIIMDDMPIERVNQVAAQFDVDVANDNSIQQVVLSGPKSGLEQACQLLQQEFADKGFRSVELTVSAPFHSRAMQGIEQEFRQFLLQHKSEFEISNLNQVASNYLGRFYQQDLDELIHGLACQLSGSVKWCDNMDALLTKTHDILELGPNRPLRGFFKTLGVDITAIINTRNLTKILATQQQLEQAVAKAQSAEELA